MFLSPEEIHDLQAGQFDAWHRIVRQHIDTLHACLELGSNCGGQLLDEARDQAGRIDAATPVPELIDALSISTKAAWDAVLTESLIRTAHVAGNHLGQVMEIIDTGLGGLGQVAARFDERVHCGAPWAYVSRFKLAKTGLDGSLEEAAMSTQTGRQVEGDMEQEFRRELTAPVAKMPVRRRTVKHRTVVA